ncbi:sensor histidine kinase [Zobellia laminariae]|uniref:sensor histidine kinase n=1 Tax=Zobellia laminariae TaxID=248906 RepID=UPI004057C08C
MILEYSKIGSDSEKELIDLNDIVKNQSKDLRIRIYVKDNGIGIDKKNQDNIFEVFKRLHNQEDYEGTGIGLAHCKKIVELHKGKIWVQSEIGKGCTFLFNLNL